MGSHRNSRDASSLVDWLLQSDEPWTRYRTLVDLLDRPDDDPEVALARAETLAHPAIGALRATAGAWSHRALKRHNDAAHPLHALAVLADFGLRYDDPGMGALMEGVLARQSEQGAFQTLVNVPAPFGGTGKDGWTWLACDAPVVLHFLLATGLPPDERLARALEHLASLAGEGGWRCCVAPELGRFRGPGRKGDPCPIANLYALRALAQAPLYLQSTAALAGCQMLLGHWERGGKFYLFGVGGDFRKLKYPFVWYDVLHALDVLSRFPAAQADPRLRAMLDEVVAGADADGRYTAASAYQAWRGWSFADKQSPSPWLTFLVLRVRKRVGRWP